MGRLRRLQCFQLGGLFRDRVWLLQQLLAELVLLTLRLCRLGSELVRVSLVQFGCCVFC